jgi:peptidase, S41 family
MMTRYQHGEFFSQDSIKHTGPAYHTNNGRIVYGGGGITPDIFIPEDTSDITSYYKEAAMRGLILQFAFKYTDDNRQTLNKYPDLITLSDYLKGNNLVNDFANYAEKNGLQRRNNLIHKSHSLLENYINSRIIYNMLDEQAWNQYLNRDNDMIKAAIKVLNSGEAFPKAPIKRGGMANNKQSKTT